MACWQSKALSWLLTAFVGMLLCGAAQAQVIVIRQAQIKVETQSGTREVTNQALPFKWDAQFPGENGSVVYKLGLPADAALRARQSQEVWSIYIPRVGNQVRLSLNGHALFAQARWDDTASDTSQTPFILSLPVSLLREEESNQLIIQTSLQALRWGGLSEVYVGPERALRQAYGVAEFWQQTSYVVILVALVLMGLIAALIWWRQRTYESAKLYLYFFYSALAGSIAALVHLLMQHNLTWPIQGIVTAIALAWHVIFMSRFALEVAGRSERWVSLAMLTTTVAIGIAYVLAEPFYWTIMFGLLCLPLVAALVCSAQVADSERSGQARLLFFVSLIAALVALRDFFIVQWPASGISQFVLLPHALFLFVLVMGGILVRRYTEQHRLYHELNVTLEARVGERERELADSFAALRQQAEERAKLLERQRIMQDIHDGVGGQLVGLVNLAKRGGLAGGAFDHRQIQEHAQLALDELRIAVDALQPVDGDLATVLATLRYRLEPRLKELGIRLVWRVNELPLMLDLTPRRVMQIQKILLEAFTNIMRHAHAKVVVVSAGVGAPESGTVALSIADDGIGFEPEHSTSQGHGLRNMRFRAEAIGAHLSVARGLPQGTTITLEIPL